MLTTRVCGVFGITHPVVLGGMGLDTNPELVAAVSNAGARGTANDPDRGLQLLPPARELPSDAGDR